MRALWIVLLFCSSLCATDVQVGVEKYAAALREEGTDKKTALLNEALKIFLSYEGGMPSGELLYNIGNTYFHLNDLGLAIAYYRRAQVHLPRNPRVLKNLATALQQAEVEGRQIYSPLVDFLGVRWLSPFERGLLSIGLIAATVLFFSIHLWLPGYGFRWIWRISALVTLLFISAIGLYALFIPLRAVVIEESPLRTSLKKEAESLSILTPGEMIVIVSYHADNGVIEVRTSMDVKGYLPSSKVVVIGS
jgi:tetratricopeptide (TPR) repeat protein